MVVSNYGIKASISLEESRTEFRRIIKKKHIKDFVVKMTMKNKFATDLQFQLVECNDSYPSCSKQCIEVYLVGHFCPNILVCGKGLAGTHLKRKV